jgi:hypothetical protein
MESRPICLRVIPPLVVAGLLVAAVLLVNGSGAAGRTTLVPLIGLLPLLVAVVIWGFHDSARPIEEDRPRRPLRVSIDVDSRRSRLVEAKVSREPPPEPTLEAPGEAAPEPPPEPEPEPVKKVLYVASATSGVYHRPDCAHAVKIPEDARLDFPNKKKANASGRRPCARCVGK